jgi:hypothetical protein
MDDRPLHDLLDGALAGEPPIGPVTQNSLAAGIRLRRRRWARAAATAAAAAAVIAVAIPASLGAFSHPPGPAGPHRPPTLYVVERDASRTGAMLNSTTVVPVNTATNTPGKPVHLDSSVGGDLTSGVDSVAFTADGKTAYFLTGLGMTPFNTVTNTPGKPIPVSPSHRHGFPVAIAVTPDGKTVYVVSEGPGGSSRPNTITATVTPISTATNTPGKPIPVGGRFNAGPYDGSELIAVTPDGKTVYVAAGPSVTPISTATNTPGKPIHIRNPAWIAFTPDGKTAYVANLPITPGAVTSSTVIPISTATNRAGKPIHIGNGQLFRIAITPDGKTAYVTTELHKVQSTPFYMRSGTITPINTATNTPGQPIPVSGIGQITIGEIAITPDGKTAYVDQSGTITPISTTTNTPGTPIRVRGGTWMTITPDGKTLYVLTGSGTVVPISTATDTPGQPIRVGRPGFLPWMAITP